MMTRAGYVLRALPHGVGPGMRSTPRKRPYDYAASRCNYTNEPILGRIAVRTNNPSYIKIFRSIA